MIFESFYVELLIVIEQLDPIRLQLLQRFYREQKSAVRPSKESTHWILSEEQQWVAVASVRLLPNTDQGWLTGLHVHANYRQRGYAHALLSEVQAYYSKVWLFCEPKLVGFYQHCGYQLTEELPDSLATRLARYQQHKALVAFCSSEIKQGE